MSRQRSEDARRGRRIQGVSPLLHPPCFQPQSAGWELNHTRNCCQCSKQCIFYLKALAGLKTLTDKSPEKRLEPLQEHLTFPALIYLRWIFCIRDSAFSVMMLVFEWSCRQEAKPGWKLHHICAGLCLLSIFKNTLDGLLPGERPAEVFSPRFQSIFPSLFPVPVFFWWVERMYWQVRVSSLLLSRRLKAFFWYEITLRKWPIGKIL